MISALAKYIGIPYIRLGRTPEGVDCWGAVRLIYMCELNIILPIFLCYDEDGAAEAHAHAAAERESEDWIKLSNNIPDLRAYDILLYNRRLLNGTRIPHVTVYEGEGRIIHCLEDIGICRDRIDRLSTFRTEHNSFVGAYRHRRMMDSSQFLAGGWG
jgi:cell wall-associated NlpC family hydrolase